MKFKITLIASLVAALTFTTISQESYAGTVKYPNGDINIEIQSCNKNSPKVITCLVDVNTPQDKIDKWIVVPSVAAKSDSSFSNAKVLPVVWVKIGQQAKVNFPLTYKEGVWVGIDTVNKNKQNYSARFYFSNYPVCVYSQAITRLGQPTPPLVRPDGQPGFCMLPNSGDSYSNGVEQYSH